MNLPAATRKLVKFFIKSKKKGCVVMTRLFLLVESGEGRVESREGRVEAEGVRGQAVDFFAAFAKIV